MFPVYKNVHNKDSTIKSIVWIYKPVSVIQLLLEGFVRPAENKEKPHVKVEKGTKFLELMIP